MSQQKSDLFHPDLPSECDFSDLRDTPDQRFPIMDCPPDIEEILEFEFSLTSELRNLIEQAVSSPGTTLLTKHLVKPTISVTQVYRAKRNPRNKYMPSILIEGPTYHDGIMTSNLTQWMEINKKRMEISVIRRLTFREIRNIVITEWSVFEKNDLDPRIKHSRLKGNLPPHDNRNDEKTFTRSLSHTLYTDNKRQMDRYLELFHHQKT